MAEETGSIRYDVDVRTSDALKSEKVIDKSISKVEKSFNRLDTQVTKTSKGVNKGLANMSRGAGQAGIQFQQFIGQIQGGQGFMLAFSQQAADLGIVLGAPLLGAITGISASIAGIFLPALFKGVEGIKELSESSKILRDNFDKLSQAEKKILQASLVEQYKEQKKEANALQIEINKVQSALVSAQNTSGRFLETLFGDDPDKLQAELTKLRASLSSANVKLAETGEKIKDIGGKEAEAAKETKKVTEEINDLITSSSILAATYGKTEREIAVYTATMLGATDAQITQINSTYDIVEAKKAEEKAVKAAEKAQKKADRDRTVLKTKTASLGLSPEDALRAQLAREQELLRKANEQKLIIDTDYQARKSELEKQFMADLDIARKKSNEDQLLSYEALENQISGTFASVAIGAQDGEDAVKSLASSILTQLVGALIQQGIQTVTNGTLSDVLKGKTVANIAAVTAADTASKATSTATSVAQAGTVAAAAAAPAALTSTYSFGTAALIGGAAVLGTLALVKASSGRQFGGSVNQGSVYEVGEAGPEIYSSGGKSYLLPDRNGNVISNSEATGGSGGGNKTVNLSLSIDPRTPQDFSDELYNNRELITNIIEKSFNDRGKVF